MKKLKSILTLLYCLAVIFTVVTSVRANVPGGGTGTGANVTVTTNGANVVLANGIVSITINTTNGNVTNFTYNGTNLLAGGNGGGSFYFDGSGGPTLTNPVYTLTVNPTNNGGNQAEVWLQSTASPMDMAVYYDLLRGQQGIYDTLILTHEAGYPDYPGAELRTNMYVGSIFDWLVVDTYRFRQMAAPNDTTVAVPGAPPEVMQWTSGIYNGYTNCKYSYSDPLGQLDTWGWASSTSNYGVWQTLPSHEYYDGGPMHRELTEHIGNTLLNMFGGGHYGFGSSGDQPAGTFSSKTFGPAFIYANQYTGAASDPTSLKARVLWADAKAQAAAEQTAWPYTWFNPQPVAGGTGTVYPQASGRGTVSGTLAINDPYNPGTSPVSLWIGLAPVDNGIDFQQQYLTCQFWVKTGSGGSFTIPKVLPGTYNLWAFGPGVVGTFEQANITVATGQALNLGTVTWTPLRLGPTVWEIGTPDRNSNEFNNGEHQSTPYSGILPAYAGGPPYDIPTDWGAFMDYTNQYPNGVSYVVGTSDYGTDWNYCQPTVPSGATYIGSTSKIFFNLASAPTAAQNARLYIAFASAFSSACILTINGTIQTASVMGSTDGTYAAIANSANGFYPPNVSFDAIVRLGSQGSWGDAYLDFTGTKLKAGMNEIDIALRPAGGASLGQGFEYDYVRLELTGYATPTPTPSGANTSTATPTVTRTNTLTAMPSVTPTRTPTLTPSFTFTSTATATLTATRTATATTTLTSTATRTNSATPTPTATATLTATYTRTNTATASPTATSTPTTTASSTSTASSTPTKTSTSTLTNTATMSVTRTTTVTATPSLTSTPTSTLMSTATTTGTPTSTLTSTSTPFFTSTVTTSSTGTATGTETLTTTPTPSWTQPPTASPTVSLTPSATASQTPTISFTYTGTASPAATTAVTDTLTVSPTQTMTSTPTVTFTPTLTSTSIPTATSTATIIPTNTVIQPSPTGTPTPIETEAFTATPSPTATNTPSATMIPVNTPTPTPSATPVDTQTSTFSPTLTSTGTPSSFVGTGKMGIFPNPAHGATVEILPAVYPGVSNVRIEVYTVAFRKVQDVTYTSVSSGMPVGLNLVSKWGDPLANGIYYLVVTTKGGKSTGKLLILR